MATLREAFSFDETLTKPDAAATGLAHLLTRDKPRKPVPLPPVSASRGAEPGPAEWAEGVAPDGTIMLNDLQQQLINLAQQIELYSSARAMSVFAKMPGCAPSHCPPCCSHCPLSTRRFSL
jgi:hypothetical protein